MTIIQKSHASSNYVINPFILIMELETVINMGRPWTYKVLTKLGQSSFGIIWRVQNVVTGKQFAMKTVNSENMVKFPSEQKDIWPNALRHEQQYLSRLDHAHIVNLHHFGEYQNSPILILEELQTNLSNAFNLRQSVFSINEALEIMVQISSGLNYLHKNGIRHRDLNPSNILLTLPGHTQRAKIADFGQAIGLDPENELADSQKFTGSRGWLAPEQIFPLQSNKSNHQALSYQTGTYTDVYALGLILFFLLTGRHTEFSKSVKANLKNHPTEIFDHFNKLKELAFVGLTKKDLELLNPHLLVKTKNSDKFCSSPNIQSSFGSTWIPVLKPTNENHDNFEHLEKLLLSLLAENVEARIPDASAANRAFIDFQRQHC